MKEIFTDFEINEIIEDNKQLVAQRGDSFCVNNSDLSFIFTNVNNFDEITIFQDRIIRKASWILGGISFYQPFCDGNKEIAVSLTIFFLRENDMDLPITDKQSQKELFDLLVKTIFKFENDPTIIPEIEQYVRQRVISI
ncbi:hypothetical protein [Nitrosopumilus sp.]|uniref:hypothetical protein n=1 Tax=Nitrosopumilus sp. TaxID=2024843 RepID=UPI003D148F83